jgi:hypothetical protein
MFSLIQYNFQLTTVMFYLKSCREIVKPVAFTGFASTLMDDARTLHPNIGDQISINNQV